MTDETAFDSAVFDEINNAIIDLRGSTPQTFERALKRLSGLLHSPGLESFNKSLIDGVDFDVFLAASKNTGGGMVGSHKLIWPDDRNRELGLTLILIDRLAADPHWAINFCHTYFYSGSKIIAGIHTLTSQVLVPFARDYRARAAKSLGEIPMRQPVGNSGKALQHNDQSLGASRTMTASTSIDSRRVFVVYGRNSKARDGVFDFLRAIDLAPMEWEEVIGATNKPSPYIGEALEAGFSIAQAAVVILTGDDMARVGKRYLKPDDTNEERVLTPQPRPNVLFEAGMALGKYPDRTVLVSLGSYRKFSDIDGRHLIRLSNNAPTRQTLADRLRIAGCAVKTENKSDWLRAGDFEAAIEDADVIVGKSRIRLRTFKRELRLDPEATFKRKIWIELKNESDECLLLRSPVWKTIPGGIHAAIRAGTFQLQLGNTWCPEKIGAQQVNLPPSELCRLWAKPDEELLDAQIKHLCRSDAPFGSVVMLANGEEISIPV